MSVCVTVRGIFGVSVGYFLCVCVRERESVRALPARMMYVWERGYFVSARWRIMPTWSVIFVISVLRVRGVRGTMFEVCNQIW